MKFTEAQQAEQRIQSIVEEWKRELESMMQQIQDIEFDIKKNRLIWSDEEKLQKETELKKLQADRESFARAKFEPRGDYDAIVKQIMDPVETKIYAAVQKVASDQGFDMIMDHSKQAIPYVNYKYDMTLKVLRELGVDVDEMEKELQKKIDKDPRNKKKANQRPAGRRKKSRYDPNKSADEQQREIKLPEGKNKKPNIDPNPEGENPEEENPPEEGEG